MSDAIIVGLLAALASIIAAVVTSKATQNKVQEDLRISNEVQNVKIEHLAEEVHKHNAFGERIPVVEGDVRVIKEQIKVVNHRIEDLERRTG